jgi:V/A-type H+-transporting ATPase subunit I
MIKPVKMKKLSAVILNEKKDAVLRELKERRAIHFLKVEEEASGDVELSPGRTEGINVKAGEHLSKIDAMLEVFDLAKDEEDTSLLKKLTQEPVKPVETVETSPSELLEEVNEKLSALEDRVFEISSRLDQIKKEREEISTAKEVMEKLKLLKVNPADLEGFTNTFIAVGTISTVEVQIFRDKVGEVTDLFYFNSVEYNKTESIALVVVPKEFEPDVRRLMHIHRFEEFRVPASIANLTLEEAARQMETKLSQMDEEEKRLLAEVKELKDAKRQELLLMQESLQIEKLLDETNTYFGNTATSFLLRGWVPVDRVDEVKQVIERAADNHCVVVIEDPKPHEDHPPTLLYNNPIAKPMEALVNTYGTPSYGLIDPSALMAMSFPILFGLMFGDVGQGLVLVGLGYLLGFRFNVDEAAKKIGRVILYCGIAATLAGALLYGEMFGQEFLFLDPIWSHPIHRTADLIGFSYFIALAQLTLGCLIKIADELSHGKPLHAIFNPWGVMGLWLFWGGASVLMERGIDGTFATIFGLFDPATRVASLMVLGPTVFLPMVLIAIGMKFVEGLAVSWSIYEAYEAFTRFLFNSISYIRVGALAIVHAVFAYVMNLGIEASSNIILDVVILIVGNIFIIVMETLISFIQALRLHYYEWFSKFYEGEGTPFKAFGVLRKYTFLAPLQMEVKT